ncbi:MAG: hypothetical protein OEX98_07460 [Nitrosopumilus sp.]|nr:hypothetical protein [Nitrosopumilus sp.]
MKVKCPCCNRKFLPFEDDIFLDNVRTYDDQYVWTTIPVLRSIKTNQRYHPEYISECHHNEQYDSRGDTDNDSLEEES